MDNPLYQEIDRLKADNQQLRQLLALIQDEGELTEFAAHILGHPNEPILMLLYDCFPQLMGVQP